MALEIIKATFPVPPPTGSVVLTTKNKAWQLADNGHWYCASPGSDISRTKTWGHLLVDDGPLTLIHIGDE